METVLDYRDKYDADSIFSPEGDPLGTYCYEPWLDASLTYAGIADTDGDGRDEIYGALMLNGRSNADNMAYVNVLCEWTDDGWKLLASTISGIDSPRKGLPGVTPPLYPYGYPIDIEAVPSRKGERE